MKYLKKFNESIEEQIYNQVLDSIKDCFLEFEDKGWYWMSDVSYPGISVWQMPNFNCRMINKHDSDPRNWHEDVVERQGFIDWTGRITSDGEIVWETKDLTNKEFKDITEGPMLDEADDFLVAVKRLHEETGLDFNFSYNNKGGEKRIIIQGRI